MDALDLIPSTLRLIHAEKGQYVVGLKANQAHLYRSCTLTDLFSVADYERVDAKVKKHGRVEQRHYRSFTLAASMVDGGCPLAADGCVHVTLRRSESGEVGHGE